MFRLSFRHIKAYIWQSATFVFLVPSAMAQVKWIRADAEFEKLPSSVHVYKSFDSLSGRPFRAWYLVASLRDRNLEFTTQTGRGKRFTPTQYYQSGDSPLVVVNCSFFSYETNQNLNLVIQRGKMVAYNVPALKSRQSDSFYYPTRGAIGITRSRNADVAWLFTDTARKWPYAFQLRPVIARGLSPDPDINDLHTLDNWRWWKMQTAVGGGPVLLQNGKVFITHRQEQIFVNELNDRHPRTAMGYTRDRKLIILVIQGRFPGIAEGATLEEEAMLLKNLRCVEALNLDGGGSSCMLVNGKETIRPSDKEGQRAIPAVFIIREKKRKR